MSYKIRGKGVAYDNIASGSATGRENYAAVGADPTTEKAGGLDNIAVGSKFDTTDQPYDNIAVGSVTPIRDNPATTPASS